MLGTTIVRPICRRSTINRHGSASRRNSGTEFDERTTMIRTFISSISAAILLMFGAAAYAQPAADAGQPPPTTAPPVAAPGGLSTSASSAYILGRDDAVQVGMLGGGGFGGTTRVQADGTIQLPLIG